MQKRMWVGIALLLVVPGLLLTASCAKKQIQPTETTASQESQEAARRAQAEKQRRKAEQQRLKEEALKEQATKQAQQAKDEFGSEDIHFEFDSSVLASEAQGILKKKAAYLEANPSADVLIEGNCDERGSEEYNLALGDRRAVSAKTFLVNLGISASRISTISYGEEKPLDTAHTEAAYAKNRRDHFVLK